MQKTLRTLLILSLTLFATSALNAIASSSKNYTEQEFLSAFSGKSRQMVTETLGKPFKKELAVKPQNTDQVLKDKNIGETTQKEIIEMWYYKVNVSYGPNKFFNSSELTFVNDKCVNITFSNKK